MPSRNNSMIRRDINRLSDLITRESPNEPALAVIAETVGAAATKVNTAWQAYQQTSVLGDKEREERDTAIGNLVDWIQRWRPVIMIKVPGAEANIKNLPSSGATPDDVIRVAEDMLTFVNTNTSAQTFAEQVKQNLADKLDNARKETSDAANLLPQEAASRYEFSEACIEANTVLVRALEIVRTAFGRTSPEYKQFIARETARDDADEEEENSNDQEIESASASNK